MPSAGMQAVFAVTRGLLFVLLPKEIVALDTELGVPAGVCVCVLLCVCMCVCVCGYAQCGHAGSVCGHAGPSLCAAAQGDRGP